MHVSIVCVLFGMVIFVSYVVKQLQCVFIPIATKQSVSHSLSVCLSPACPKRPQGPLCPSPNEVQARTLSNATIIGISMSSWVVFFAE